jgi:hypothetical protein
VSAFFDAQSRWVGEYDGTKSRSATDFGSLNCALTMSDGFRITTPQPIARRAFNAVALVGSGGI